MFIPLYMASYLRVQMYENWFIDPCIASKKTNSGINEWLFQGNTGETEIDSSSNLSDQSQSF